MKYIKLINENWIEKSTLSDQDLQEIKDIFSDVNDEIDYQLDEYPNMGKSGTYCVSFFKPQGKSMLINVIIDLKSGATEDTKLISKIDEFTKSFEERIKSAGYNIEKQKPGHYYYLSYIDKYLD